MGFWWLGHSKHARDTDRFILVWASGPYVQQYGILLVRNVQSGDYNCGIKRVWYGFYRFGPSRSDPPFYRSLCLPL